MQNKIMIQLSFILLLSMIFVNTPIILSSTNSLEKVPSNQEILLRSAEGSLPIKGRWISGNNTKDSYGIYGMKGVPDDANYPGARKESVSWSDLKGNLWQFGGYGYNGSSMGSLNDLWSYNLSTKKWSWVSGSKNLNEIGIYGMKGVANILNIPGARAYSISWTDLKGNLWLFGGDLGGGYLNDLWRYNISTNIWTWMSGNNTTNAYGHYGTKGVADSTNYPGARHFSTSWTDLKGNLWLIGGYGYSESGFGNLNDLWKYNSSTNIWTWIAGNKTINEYGYYGTKGVAGIANFPGARYGSTSCTDLNGHLWLFGGLGFGESGANGNLNDLWKFNTSSMTWTWISGSKSINVNGVYGTKSIPDAANFPGSRRNMISWTSSSGNLYIFGGHGYTDTGIGRLNDLWRFNIQSETWTWIFGNNTINSNGVYGTKGISNNMNYPGSREISVSWLDSAGDLWLFGGEGYDSSNPTSGYLNDLWGLEFEDQTDDEEEDEKEEEKEDKASEQPAIPGFEVLIFVFLSILMVIINIIRKQKKFLRL